MQITAEQADEAKPHCHLAHESLVMLTLRALDQSTRDHHSKLVDFHLRRVMHHLGFDLVERVTADEASRLAGAPTWKSPLDGKFAPEFLGDTPNGTTMGFR